MPERARTIYFGSGKFALPALARLVSSELVDLDSVVTAPARPAGRKGTLTPTPVADAAASAGVRLRTPTSLRAPDTLAELRAAEADLIVLADYGRIIPADVLELPRHGALNLHPSLLPRHRGAAPVAAAIMAGDLVTGVTLMRMDEGLDSGPIVAQREWPLDGTETGPQLEERLALAGAELLVEQLPGWLDGVIEARPQPAEGMSLTRPLRRSDGWLDATRSAAELERQVRAYQPWPGAFLEHEGDRLKVWSAAVLERPVPAEPGAIILAEGTIALVTSHGSLRLDEIQPAGKRRMSGAAYRRGKRI
jgi:methionyl-tRNA formyltransferase